MYAYKGILIDATTYRNLENIMLNEKSVRQKATCCMIPFMWIIRGVTADGFRISFLRDENVLKLVVMVGMLVNILKSTELFTLKEWIFWCVNHLSILKVVSIDLHLTIRLPSFVVASYTPWVNTPFRSDLRCKILESLHSENISLWTLTLVS